MKNGMHVDENGDIGWYKDDIYHREDGPAIIQKNGGMGWAINGKFHRVDGPAVVYSNGEKYFYLNGMPYFNIKDYAIDAGWTDKQLADYLLSNVV